MPRPRYESGEKTAQERLDEAFWECLREKPFEKITVANIVQKAGVNRNTFYYHFQDMNHLARTVVQETVLEPQFVRHIITQTMRGGRSEMLAQIPDFDRRVDHICLIAGKNSSMELQRMLREAFLRAWSAALDIDIESLDLEGRLAVEFALGGMMAIIAYRSDNDAEFDLRLLYDLGFNHDISRFIRHIPQLEDKLSSTALD